VTVEAGVVLDLDGNPIYWHTPQNRSVGALPDSRDLWDVFWENRKNLLGFVHSHPGGGVPGPSYTDVTTFAAVESGLGTRLHWWIISSEAAVDCTWSGPDRLDYRARPVAYEAVWLEKLRELSGYPGV
jgi:hypothetical protein